MLTYVYTHCTQGVLPWLSSPVELLFGHIQRLVVESVNKGNSSEKVGEVVACFARRHARRVSKVGNVVEVRVQLRRVAGYDDIDECRKEVVGTGRTLGGHLQGREDVVTRFAQAVQFVNRRSLGVHVC